MKKYIVSMLIAITAMSTNIYAEDITVLVNNQPVISEQKPVILDGNTYVPLRPVAEAMGCEVVWVQGTKTANIKNLTTIAAFQVDNPKITKMKRTDIANPVIVESKTPPKNINGSVYLPLRAMAETFGAKVGWDAVTRTVMIMYDTTVKYTTNMTIERYAGNGARKRYDDSVDKMEFLSPESIDVADDGSIYISDTGTIRKITDGKSSTVESNWFYGTAGSAKNAGIIKGYEDNTFRGNVVIPKVQIVSVSARVLKNEMGYYDVLDVEKALIGYGDRSAIAKWAESDVALATDANMVIKRTDGLFGGTAEMTRGDAAIILRRLFDKVW